MKLSDEELALSAADLENELNWLRHLLNFRGVEKLRAEGNAEALENLPEFLSSLLKVTDIRQIHPPDLSQSASRYAGFINHYAFGFEERFILMLGLAPHIKPHVLDVFFSPGAANSRQPTEYGGVKQSKHRGFLPTGETALFALAGYNLGERMALMSFFDHDHIFRKADILKLDLASDSDPEMSGALKISREVIDFITRGYIRPPEYGNDFPARKITTEMDWEDLVLSPGTRREVEEVKIWIRQRKRLMSEPGIRKRLKPGYKILFYGAPGTGKTLTAQLLGKYIEKDVFRIDLSSMVSKYIGETEKNLAKVFDKADNSDWILFFDEADALFGSRTKVSSSHDRYANQEVSYLLQRIEDFEGIVILASNMKNNIDDAFMRRFSSVVHFPFPKQEERRLLWEKAFPEKMSFPDGFDLRKISDKYEVSGANITNIVAWCSLMALEKEDFVITEQMIREGMARELAKEGRTL